MAFHRPRTTFAHIPGKDASLSAAQQFYLHIQMNARGVEKLEAGQYIARFTTVLSNRSDTTVFKREHAEMYKRYTKQTTSHRVSIG